MMIDAEDRVIRKEIHVNVPLERAFVLEYDQPSGFLLRWRVNPAKPPTELKVAFFAEGDGTRVQLTHAGWESFADDDAEELQGYTSGWDTVLGRYVTHVKG